jgi:hypothetical protein
MRASKSVLNLFLTGTVQVVALLLKELATSCESLPDFLTARKILRGTTKKCAVFVSSILCTGSTQKIFLKKKCSDVY